MAVTASAIPQSPAASTGPGPMRTRWRAQTPRATRCGVGRGPAVIECDDAADAHECSEDQEPGCQDDSSRSAGSGLFDAAGQQHKSEDVATRNTCDAAVESALAAWLTRARGWVRLDRNWKGRRPEASAAPIMY